MNKIIKLNNNKKIINIFDIILIASKKARELQNKYKKNNKILKHKYTVIALQEINNEFFKKKNNINS